MASTNTSRGTKKLMSILDQDRYKIPFIFILSAALAILMFGENIKAQWWVIDDHEIAYFLGSDHILKANEFVDKLFHDTEVGMYLHYPRFRPVYYILRLSECLVWGDRVLLWYAFRIFVFSFFASTFWYLASKRTGFFISGLITLYMMTFPFWQDIVARLGPSEIYGVLGMALFGIGIFIVYQNNRIMGWLFILIASIICTGSKENFLFLLLPLAYITFDFFVKRDLGIIRGILSFSAALWMIWIAYVVVRSTRSLGGDIYGNSVQASDRLVILLDLFKRTEIIALLSLCIVLLIVHLWLRQKKSSLGASSLGTVIIICILALIYVSQIILYQGEWPGGNRYDFPGLLLGPLLLVILIDFSQRLTTRFRTGLNFLNIIVVLSMCLSQFNNIHEAQIKSYENVAKTTVFSEKMKQLVQISSQHADHVLIIQAEDPGWDYEPVFSYIRFLRFYGVKNTAAFLWAGPEPKKIGNRFDKMLAVDLRDISLHGKTTKRVSITDPDYTPLPDVINRSDLPCILIIISGDPKINCPIMVISHWR